MAKKLVKASGNEEGKADGSRRARYRPVRWVNPSPNGEDEKWLDDNDDVLTELCFALFNTIPEDGKLTVKYDGDSTRWIAILFMVDSGVSGGLVALSVRGATPVDALILLAYFHQIKFESGWDEVSSGGKGRWG